MSISKHLLENLLGSLFSKNKKKNKKIMYTRKIKLLNHTVIAEWWDPAMVEQIQTPSFIKKNIEQPIKKNWKKILKMMEDIVEDNHKRGWLDWGKLKGKDLKECKEIIMKQVGIYRVSFFTSKVRPGKFEGFRAYILDGGLIDEDHEFCVDFDESGVLGKHGIGMEG